MKIHAARLAAHSRERGFTLVELMVASTLALVMLVGVSELYLSTKSTENTNSSASELTTNGRYAIDLLRRDLMHAGFRGIAWAQPSPISTTIATFTPTTPWPKVPECIGSGFSTNLRQGVWGSNDNNPFSATCIPAANYSKGDVLVIRHANLIPVTPPALPQTSPCPNSNLKSNTLYFRSAYERGEVFQGSKCATLAVAFTQTPSSDYELATMVYYVSPFTSSSTETPLVPALYRVVLGDGPAMKAELVASNIENMQVRYGRLTTDLNTQFYPASTVSTTATGTTSTPTEWDAVNSVRVWILVRSSKPEPGYKNANTYTLGDQAITVNDGYRRELFTTVVQLRNI